VDEFYIGTVTRTFFPFVTDVFARCAGLSSSEDDWDDSLLGSSFSPWACSNV